MTLTHKTQSDNVSFEAAPPRRAASPDATASRGVEDHKTGDCPILPQCSDDAMPSPDAPQPALVLHSRAELRDLLIKAGLARAAAEKVARGGWPELAGELTETDLLEDAAKMARALAETLKGI